MIDIEIEDEAWIRALPNAAAISERAAKAALGQDDIDVALLLTSDAAVQELNGQFRGKDKPTNVLSFPAPQSASPHIGDVALAFGVCAAEAKAQNKPLADHLMHLTVHGVLHLLGYDHEADAEAEDMEGVERDILATLGVPDPYAHPEDRGPDAATL